MFSNPKDSELIELLKNSKNIAVVGLSPKPERPSHYVAEYLQRQGYKIIPVNPGHKMLLGEKSYPDLKSIPGRIDVVDVFRNPAKVLPIVEEAIEIGGGTIWFQEGIINEQAADIALKNGLKVIMDRCMLKEHMRLIG